MTDPGVNAGDTWRWRVGRTLGRTIYLQAGDDPAKGDVCVGLADTIPLAQQVVDVMNGVPREPVVGAHAVGRLVFFEPAVSVATGFCVCMDTPELAGRVAQALRDRKSVV